MQTRSVLIVSTVVFVCGLLAGREYQAGFLTSSAQARALTPGEAQQAYQELDSEDGSLMAGSERLAMIARVTSPSVVHVQSERSSERGGRVEETGSGVFLQSSKVPGVFVVTNRHVVAEARLEDISLHLGDGRVIRPSRVWADEATDVAVLKVDAQNLSAARWGDSDRVDIGHLVLALGSPFGLSQSVTLGIISAKGRRSLNLGDGRSVLNQDFLQTDAAINPGNSGGPLIDLHGRVIGINTAIASNSGGNEGIGFSIPSNLVRRVVDQLLLHGKVQRAYLGVKLDSEYDVATARRLQVGRLRGARVVEVYPNTPASLAKLEFDDVILKFEDVEVLDENHLINLVSLTPIGRTVRLEVLRNGRPTSLDVLLADRTELERRAAQPTPENRSRTTVRPMSFSLREVDQHLGRQLGFRESVSGLVVMRLDREPRSPADLQLYDVIEEAARSPIRTWENWQQVLSPHDKSDPLLLKVRRQQSGQTQQLLVLWQP